MLVHRCRVCSTKTSWHDRRRLLPCTCTHDPVHWCATVPVPVPAPVPAVPTPRPPCAVCRPDTGEAVWLPKSYEPYSPHPDSDYYLGLGKETVLTAKWVRITWYSAYLKS